MSLRSTRHLVLGLVVGLQFAAAADPADPEKPPARPSRSDTERAGLAARLRAIYRGDPNGWPKPHVDDGIAWREIGLIPPVEHPQTNPFNHAKAELGRMLFFDPRLSAGGKMACVSCHEPSLGWADGRPVGLPPGHSPPRNTPTIRNIAFQSSLFWDGRAGSLEEQAEQALANPSEMAADRDQVVRLLSAIPTYRRHFDEAFSGRPIAFASVVQAIACFERTIVSGRSRFDEFLRGDAAALTDAELLGLDLFRREARCMNCHHGPAFSDGRFHDLGLSFYGRSNEDLGRRTVTGEIADTGRFRTPTLRDVTSTSPLMHTGMFRLPGVLTMYNVGMVTLKRQPYQRNDPRFPVKSPHLKPLGLNRQDLGDLAAFLGSLEEPKHRVMPPRLPDLDAANHAADGDDAETDGSPPVTATR